MRLCVR
jgi:hypothetical protein